MRSVNVRAFEDRDNRGTEVKHTPFSQTPTSHPPLSFLIHSALSEPVLSSQSARGGGEEEEKREGGSGESWPEPMGGRKDREDRSACSSARLKRSA